MLRGRRYLCIGSILIVLLGSQMANAEPVTKRYEQSGDPVLVCQLAADRPSAKGVCFDIPAGSNYADIYLWDDIGQSSVAFKVTVLDAAGVPVYATNPYALPGYLYGEATGYGTSCGFRSVWFSQEAKTLKVELVQSWSCGTGASGRVDALFGSSGGF